MPTQTQFKDLKKFVADQLQIQQHNAINKEQFYSLQDKPFWIWSREEHMQEYADTNGQCCFNHIIGLPRKDNVEKPMFPYEKTCTMLSLLILVIMN